MMRRSSVIHRRHIGRVLFLFWLVSYSLLFLWRQEERACGCFCCSVALTIRPTTQTPTPPQQLLRSRLYRPAPSKSQKSLTQQPAPSTADAAQPPFSPPLVICIGFAQRLEHWEFHATQICRQQQHSRRQAVLVVEPLGLGQQSDHPINNVSLPYQAEQLLATIHHHFPSPSSKEQEAVVVDVAGFSLGGRIVLALLSISNNNHEDSSRRILQIRKIHITGVGWQRPDAGVLQVWAWKEHLRHKDMRALAMSVLLSSYSAKFLLQQQQQQQQSEANNNSKLLTWMDGICDYQTCRGLLALLEQAYPDDTSDEWSVASMTSRLVKQQQQPESPPNNNLQVVGRLVVGQDDNNMASVDSVQQLADHLNWSVGVVPDVGHAVSLEAPRLWRTDLSEFLDDDDEGDD